MLNYCNVIVVLLIYQKYLDLEEGSRPTGVTGPLKCRKDKCCDGRIGNRKYFKTFWKLLVFCLFSSLKFYVQSVILYTVLQF